MNYKLAAILGIFLFGLYGCDPDEINASFTDEEVAWLIYDSADTAVFQNEAGTEKNLHVGFKTEMTQLSDHYPIEAEVSLVDTAEAEYFRLYLLKDEKSFKKYLRLGNIYRSLDLIEPIDTMTVGDRIFEDVYVVIDDTSDGNFHIWRAFFNKEYGILGYDTKDGKSFVLKHITSETTVANTYPSDKSSHSSVN